MPAWHNVLTGTKPGQSQLQKLTSIACAQSLPCLFAKVKLSQSYPVEKEIRTSGWREQLTSYCKQLIILQKTWSPIDDVWSPGFETKDFTDSTVGFHSEQYRRTSLPDPPGVRQLPAFIRANLTNGSRSMNTGKDMEVDEERLDSGDDAGTMFMGEESRHGLHVPAQGKKRGVLPADILQCVTRTVTAMNGDQLSETVFMPLKIFQVELEKEMVWTFSTGKASGSAGYNKRSLTVKRKMWKKRKSDDSKTPRVRPNHFIAVPTLAPSIVSKLKEVQESVIQKNEAFRDAMVSVATAHLTFMVINLENEEHLEKAKTALDDCGEVLEKRLTNSHIELSVKGIGSFRDEVVFAKVEKSEALDKLYIIDEVVRMSFAKHGIFPTDDVSFAPHITIMKLSKNLMKFKKIGVKKISKELYCDFEDAKFGVQPVTSLQLCAMSNPKDDSGYYRVPHSVPIGGAVQTP